MKTENTTSLQGVHKKYFKNGQLKEVKLFKNGLELFKNGLENGPYSAYFASGERKISANFKNGKLNGLYERWDIKGNLIVCKTYSDGKLLATRVKLI